MQGSGAGTAAGWLKRAASAFFALLCKAPLNFQWKHDKYLTEEGPGWPKLSPSCQASPKFAPNPTKPSMPAPFEEYV